MHVLFVHQNFPAQFQCVAPRLAADYGWRCTFATRNTKGPDLPGVERVQYPSARAPRVPITPARDRLKTQTGTRSASMRL